MEAEHHGTHLHPSTQEVAAGGGPESRPTRTTQGPVSKIGVFMGLRYNLPQ